MTPESGIHKGMLIFLPRKVLFAILLWAGVCVSFAEVRLPAIFSEHMVLQAGVNIAVWGWADPGESVEIEFAEQRASATADEKGRWHAKLNPVAEGYSGQMRVAGQSNSCVVNDVLVGEVWLCAGQSNMGMALKRTEHAEQDIASADNPQIRIFLTKSPPVATPQQDCDGRWIVCSPNAIARVSAVAYYFGKELNEVLGCPVGLIQTALGGTPIEAWTSREALKSMPSLQPLLEQIENNPGDVEAANREEIAYTKHLPAYMYNAQISPIVPYTIRGCIWYQGEANTQPWKAAYYQEQLPLLIRDWRARWGYEFPFAYVQLPGYNDEKDHWPVVRDAMLATLSVPQTGMVVTLDLGESDNLHPVKKKEIGERLSLWALHDVYGKSDIVASGPLLKKVSFENDTVILTFLHADGGLVARDDALEGFEISPDGKTWQPAEAVIVGDNTVAVKNPTVRKPVAARYAWENDPPCTLYNEAGLPGSPFNTATVPTSNGNRP